MFETWLIDGNGNGLSDQNSLALVYLTPTRGLILNGFYFDSHGGAHATLYDPQTGKSFQT